jgi:hypothetical protein
MKKSIYYIYLAFVVFALQGCPVIPQAEISGKEKGHGYIDMGTSVMWSPVNLGATTMGEYGDYYAWGETEPKQYYSILTYKWCDGDTYSFTKYVLSKDCGAEVDSLTVLELEDDAAHVHWGGTWRLPTKEEMQELYDNCEFEYIHGDAGRGILVTAKNGNTLFFPLTYDWDDGVKWGYYWTSSLCRNTTAAYILWLTDNKNATSQMMRKIRENPRYLKASIRPVCVPKSK